MKSIIFTSLFILFSATAFGQTQDTTTQRQNQQKKQKMDRFIDRDGDGICDQREQGLGFKRGKHREEKQRGKGQNVQGEKPGTKGTVQPTGSGTGNQYRGGKQ